jgi:hypothetical protein
MSQANLKRTILIFLCLMLVIGSPLSAHSGKPGVLLVVSRGESAKATLLQQVINWKTKQGFNIWSISAEQFINAKALKVFLQEFYRSNPTLRYVILPMDSFFGTIACKIDGSTYDISSDMYFENLDDDPGFNAEIIVARSSIEELGEISKRTNMDKLTCSLAFPMINYDRWACVPGECLQYVKCDASHLGDDIKRQWNRKNIKAYTLYEQEGISKSFLKPDFALNEENVAKQLEQSNVVWFLNTLEPLQPKPEGYVLYSVYQDFYRSIWTEDKNDDKLITDPELTIKPFFLFSDAKSTFHRIGFLPLFDNEHHNLNQFSAVIGVNPVPCSYVPGDGTGIGESALSVFRLVMENLINGKTVGESILVFEDYRDMYPDDPYHQEYYALGLFLRGDPTLKIQDLQEKSKMEIIPGEIDTTSRLVIPINQTEIHFTIKNTGTSPLRIAITGDETLITISPREGDLEPDIEQIITIRCILSPTFYLMRNLLSSPKKKQTKITINSSSRKKEITLFWYGI